MDILSRITDAVLNGVDWIAVAIVLFGGLIAKYRLTAWKWNNALKTLIVGTLAITVYVVILKASGLFTKADAPKLFFGYITATALYPILVKPVEKFIRNSVKGDDGNE